MTIYNMLVGVDSSIVKDGSTAARAAVSASAIKTLTGTTTNGYYWIKPDDTTAALQVHCDMSINGGGWMLMSYCGTGVTNGVHVADAQSGYPFNIGSTSTTLNNTTQSAGTGANLGQAFIDALVQAGRSKAIACFRIENSGTTWKNWFFSTNANSRWYPVLGGRNANAAGTAYDPTNTALAGNTWLRTCYPTYIADGGNNGAGTLSGTSVAGGNDGWGLFPYNMSISLSDNWGYSISPTYNNSTQGYATYNSCHSSGWSQRGSYWLKLA